MASFGFIPPQQVPSGGPYGTGQGPNVSLMQPNQVGQMAQAAGQLLQGAANMKQAQQAHYKQKYNDALQGIATGTLINPDYTEIMKWGKKAGIPMSTDVNPADVYAHQMTMYQQAQQQQQAQGNSGAPDNPLSGMVNLPPPQAPPSPSPAPGLLHRMGNKLNNFFGGDAGQPQPSMLSPMGKFLTALSGAAQGGGIIPSLANANEEADLDHHLQMATKKLGLQDVENGTQLTGQIFQQMINGDPTATEILAKTGHIKDMPISSLEAAITRSHPDMSVSDVRKTAGDLMLSMQTNPVELRAKMMDLQKDLLPHFDNNPAKVQAFFQDPTNPANQPHMSVTEEKDFMDSMKGILDTKVGVPVTLVSQYAAAQLAGNKSLANQLSKTIDLYPSQSEVNDKNKKTELGQNQQRINNDWANIQGTLALRGMEAQTSQFESFRKALEDTGALPTDMLEHPQNYDKQQFIDAASLVASKNNAVSALMKKYGYGPGAPTQQTAPTSGMFGLTTGKTPVSIKGTPPPGNWMAGILGSRPITPTFSDDQRLQALKQQLLRIPKDQRASVIGTTAMPDSVRQQLLDWDPEKEAADQANQGITNWLQDIGR